MAQPSVLPPGAMGPVRDPRAHRVCTLAGIAYTRENVLTLRHLRDSLHLSLADLDRQRRHEDIVNHGLMVARFAKASCDAFIDMAAALAKALLPETAGKGADTVAKIYGTSSPLVEAGAGAVTGGQADWVKAGLTAARKSTGLVTSNKGAQVLAKSTIVKAEVIKAAMNGDADGVRKPALSYVYDLHVTLAEIVGAEGSTARGKLAANRLAALMKIAKSAFDYNEQLGKAFDALLDARLETEIRHRALKQMLHDSGMRLTRSIEEMEAFAQACEQELAGAPALPLP